MRLSPIRTVPSSSLQWDRVSRERERVQRIGHHSPQMGWELVFHFVGQSAGKSSDAVGLQGGTLRTARLLEKFAPAGLPRSCPTRLLPARVGKLTVAEANPCYTSRTRED